MGAFQSRQRRNVEEIHTVANHAYRYPPRSGNYFGSHFIMGGERFDTPQPEAYLFGENSDLNFLSNKPTPFPYPPPQPSEPTKTLKCLVNVRRESLRFVRAPVDSCNSPIEKETLERPENETLKTSCFNIEFIFDTDVRCAITIYYFCIEEISMHGITYVTRDPKLTSETYHYNRGSNQQFCQMTHVFDPTKYSADELVYDVDREVIPVAIHCVAEEGSEEMRQSHTTIAIVERLGDGTYSLKALKQKLFVDGLCYLIQEMYGIENKSSEKQCEDDEPEDNGSECVICMCDVRDTLILPCRHLCLCNACADSLRYQANNCPICRAPFRALLQIRALQKATTAISPNSEPTALMSTDNAGSRVDYDNIPVGFDAVSLIEALNGPCTRRVVPPEIQSDLVETPPSDCEHAVQAAQMLNRLQTSESSLSPNAVPPKGDISTTEYGLVMNMRDEDSKETPKCPLLPEYKQAHPVLSTCNNAKTVLKSSAARVQREIVKVMNEPCVAHDQINDDDSETEKLSPLLQTTRHTNSSIIMDMSDGVTTDVESKYRNRHEIRITNIVQENNRQKPVSQENVNGIDTNDDSDYYTPEEPSQTNRTDDDGTLLCNTGDNCTVTNSLENTPQKVPGTPASHVSARSSGDSCGSGCSTRHLLAVSKSNTTNDKTVHI